MSSAVGLACGTPWSASQGMLAESKPSLFFGPRKAPRYENGAGADHPHPTDTRNVLGWFSRLFPNVNRLCFLVRKKQTSPSNLLKPIEAKPQLPALPPASLLQPQGGQHGQLGGWGPDQSPKGSSDSFLSSRWDQVHPSHVMDPPSHTPLSICLSFWLIGAG
jgi:hypothetical protein